MDTFGLASLDQGFDDDEDVFGHAALDLDNHATAAPAHTHDLDGEPSRKKPRANAGPDAGFGAVPSWWRPVFGGTQLHHSHRLEWH